MWETLYQWFYDPVVRKILFWSTIAFSAGAIGGVFVWKRKSAGDESRGDERDPSFYKGVGYILSNDHDNAIEEFTKSVKLNSDTIETYVALGNLFRSKGNIDKAIRIRQSIILRPNISEKIKIETLFNLGLDYRKGGFINRALNVFQQVLQKKPSDLKALKEVERIYEELKDWENAYNVRQKISKLEKEDHRNILAHYMVEMGKAEHQRGDKTKAVSMLKRAISIHDKCLDAYLHLGDVYFEKHDYEKAIDTWKRVVTVAPKFTFLAYRRLEGAYSRMKNLKPVYNFLTQCAGTESDPFTNLALARYLYNDKDVDGALKELDSVIGINPTFWEARRFKGQILISQGKEKEALSDYGDLINNLDMPSLRFQCSQCGFEPSELKWQCPRCREWDTIQLLEF